MPEVQLAVDAAARAMVVAEPEVVVVRMALLRACQPCVRIPLPELPVHQHSRPAWSVKVVLDSVAVRAVAAAQPVVERAFQTVCTKRRSVG